MTFRQFVAGIRKTGFLDNPGVPRDRVGEWLKDDHKRKLIFGAREAFLATLPLPPEGLPPEEPQLESKMPVDENELLFLSKIVPNFTSDIQRTKLGPGRYRTEAMLAADNLPGWSKQIARYASADFRDFFIALGKAMAGKRRLWDATDERILLNYFSSDKFEKPLSSMTEEGASQLLGLSVAAYDKRLQRLGIVRKGGRPKNQDKRTRRRS